MELSEHMVWAELLLDMAHVRDKLPGEYLRIKASWEHIDFYEEHGPRLLPRLLDLPRSKAGTASRFVIGQLLTLQVLHDSMEDQEFQKGGCGQRTPRVHQSISQF